MAASYDRELIAQMLEGARRGDLHQFSVESIERAISQLRAADNRDAAGAEPGYCAIHQSYKWCEHNGGIGDGRG